MTESAASMPLRLGALVLALVVTACDPVTASDGGTTLDGSPDTGSLDAGSPAADAGPPPECDLDPLSLLAIPTCQLASCRAACTSRPRGSRSR